MQRSSKNLLDEFGESTRIFHDRHKIYVKQSFWSGLRKKGTLDQAMMHVDGILQQEKEMRGRDSVCVTKFPRMINVPKIFPIGQNLWIIKCDKDKKNLRLQKSKITSRIMIGHAGKGIEGTPYDAFPIYTDNRGHEFRFLEHKTPLTRAKAVGRKKHPISRKGEAIRVFFTAEAAENWRKGFQMDLQAKFDSELEALKAKFDSELEALKGIRAELADNLKPL